ncbi:zinc transporter ZIP4-like [Xenia sp. Carnegie-2017]|uniref:zinc transporter ZIP4-like n=1 Tax=Xenia sp. Carnegie-2017 TaxID=2897299 RepID=UPI001F03FC98|nr:zinc transporter ZIP4-like [Xenia sp. Carnegie-2017]
MFIPLYCILCGLVQISLGSTSNEAKHYHKILKSLNNATEFNVKALDVLLEKLNLEHCKYEPTREESCPEKCGPPEHIFLTHGFGNNLTTTEFGKLSTTLLYYLLPEKNSGSNSDTCKRGHGDGAHVSTYDRLLKKYKTSGNICVRFLNRILQDVKEKFSKSQALQKPCFSAESIFREIGLSPKTNEISRSQFSNMSIVIISYLSDGHCLEVNNEEDLPCKSYFTSDIFQHFGGGANKMSFEGFKEILETIGLGSEAEHHSNDEKNEHYHDHGHSHEETRILRKRDNLNHMPIKTEQCYSADDLATIFAVNKSDGVDRIKFMEICPAMIQQLESGICKLKAEKIGSARDSTHDEMVWLYGFLSVFVISLLSLAGVAVIPSMAGQMYKKIIIVLIGLAIGTLAGDALLHLIPHATGFHDGDHGDHGSKHDKHGSEEGHHKTIIWRFLVVAFGVYGFFVFETLSCLFLQSTGQKYSHLEHSQKDSQFKRHNTCRDSKRLELLLATSPYPLSPTDSKDETKVNFNQAKGKAEEHRSKDDEREEENIAALVKHSFESTKKSIKSFGKMILIGDTLHNITDGIAIGAAFTQDIAGGLSTSIAVFCHELPHELGDFAALLSSGMSAKQALLANFLSACSSFIGLIIGILIGQKTSEGNQWIFAIMGGMFLYIALVDMLPELMHSKELGGTSKLQVFMLQNTGILCGFTLMFFIAYFEEDLVIS